MAISCKAQVSIYTIFVYLEPFVYESTILLFATPNCNAHTITILLDECCAIYDAPPTPPLYAIHNTILAMAISCQGPLAGSRWWLVPHPVHTIYTSMLEVLCAPKWFDYEFPTIKTTKLLVETRSGTWAKQIYPLRFISSCRAPLIYRYGNTYKYIYIYVYIRIYILYIRIYVCMYVHIYTADRRHWRRGPFYAFSNWSRSVHHRASFLVIACPLGLLACCPGFCLFAALVLCFRCLHRAARLSCCLGRC